ncbi:MAG TPA: DUF2628 domain-containing protein [Xanthobacteraceae bacterium]|nr:DUF2628 domain-containing protein [Xanthobacteraceae bacterium]
MAIYTVHEPPRRDADVLAHTDRFRFVRDGFSWCAFLFGPLWMLRHRLWLVLGLYVIVLAVLLFGLRAARTSPIGIVAAVELVSLLIGIEASTLRRWTLSRRRWTSLGVVVGDDLEAAERRFFDAWVKDPGVARNRAVPVAPSTIIPATHDVMGLFPEPGARS